MKAEMRTALTALATTAKLIDQTMKRVALAKSSLVKNSEAKSSVAKILAIHLILKQVADHG